MYKKILASLLLTSALTTTAEAKLIELDNFNPDHCRQQILSSLSKTDPDDVQFPVIFIYMKHCPYAEKLRPIMEQVSDETPNRTFYAFEFNDEEQPINTAKQSLTCLGYIPFLSPSVSVFMIGNDGNTPVQPMLLGEIKKGLSGNSTKQDVEDFIKVEQKINKSFTLSK